MTIVIKFKTNYEYYMRTTNTMIIKVFTRSSANLNIVVHYRFFFYIYMHCFLAFVFTREIDSIGLCVINSCILCYSNTNFFFNHSGCCTDISLLQYRCLTYIYGCNKKETWFIMCYFIFMTFPLLLSPMFAQPLFGAKRLYR